MLSRGKVMKFPFIDPFVWARLHGLELQSAPCYYCETELWTCIAFSYKEQRGLMAPVCCCGNANTPYCVTLTGWMT